MTDLFLVAALGTAGLSPTVRVEVTPKDGAWVGQRVGLTIILATPDLFAGAPVFEMPPTPGLVVLPPAGSPTVGTESVGDTTFTTQRHEFAVFAQRPGVVRVPAFPIRFESNAGFGQPVVHRTVTTEAVSFEAKSPPRAEGLGTVIAARGLKVADEWNPDPKTLRVGDAFTRTLTTAAADIPGMVLSPLRFGPIDGLSAYPKPPAVTDRTDRGSLTGQRTDAVTFVCGRPGTVTVPDRTLTWFDLDAGGLKTVKLPGRTFDVAPGSEAPAAPEQPSPSAMPVFVGRRWWLVPALGLAAAIGWLLATRVPSWWHRVRAVRAESEPAYFSRLRRACRSGDPHATYVALLAWLDHFGPTSLDELITTANDPLLSHAALGLRDRLYSRSDSPDGWQDASVFFDHVRAARRRLGDLKRATADRVLPPLNFVR